MKTGATLTLALLFIIPALAGCISDENPEGADEMPDECETDCPPDDLTSEDGRDLRTDLLINDTVPAPTWEVGDKFAQHIWDDPSDSSGFHIDSVVVEDTGDAWVIAPNNEELARRHGFWDYPFLGSFDKDTLGTSAYGNQWDFFFEFPLEHGKTWQRTLTVPHPTFFWENTYNVNFEVAYAEAVDTFDGQYPGFEVTGTTADGDLLFTYYYVPMLGWYDHFYWYDLTTEDPEDWRMHAMSMGTGKNWTGTAYVGEEQQRINRWNFFCPFVTEEMCAPQPPSKTFTLSADTRIFGVLVTAAWGGTSRSVLAPPEGEPRTYEHTNTEVPDPEGEEPQDFEAVISEEWIDEASTPGEWRFSNAGAGVFWGGFLYLVELDMQERVLE